MDWRGNTISWLGALTYSKWIWKGDGSSIYSYLGFRVLYGWYKKASHAISGNSVLACHQLCGEGYLMFGLQGNSCFCLDHRDFYNGTSDHKIMRCPGNYEELCGNRDGISVYTFGDVYFFPEKNSQCAYVGISTRQPSSFESYSYTSNGNTYYLYIKTEENCNSYVKRYSACIKTAATNNREWLCERSICLFMTKNISSSVTSLDACTKMTVTRHNAESLSKAMLEAVDDRHISINETYWIGLERQSSSKWIDGTDVNISITNFGSEAMLKCLSVVKWDESHYNFFWANCSTELSAICQISTPKGIVITTPPFQKPLSTTLTSPAPPTVVASSISTATATAAAATEMPGQTKSSLTKAAQNQSVFNPRIETPTDHESDSSRIGVYIGTALGILVVLAVVVFLMLSFRQERFCFKTKSSMDASRDVKFNTSTDDISITQNGSSSSNKTVTAPIAIVGPYERCVINASATSIQSREKINYYNVTPSNKSTSLQEKKEKKNSERETPKATELQEGKDLDKFRDGLQSSECHSVVTKSPIYNLAGSVDARAAGYYDVTGPAAVNETGEYILANTTHSESSGTYSLAHSTGVRTYSPLVSKDTQNMDSEYNVLGQHLSENTRSAANAYDPIGKPPKEGDYDTAGVSRSFHMSDDTYSHTDERRDRVDDTYNHTHERGDHPDDNYDTVQHGQKRHVRPSDDYSHTNALDVDLDENLYHVTTDQLENEEDESSTYHSIDDSNIHETDDALTFRSNTEYEDISFARH